MARYTDAQLASAANMLANRPRHMNPALSPSAMNTIPSQAQGLVQAVLNSPQHAAMAAGSSVHTVNPGGSSSLDPHQQKRNPHNRVQLLGFVTTSIGSAAQVGVTATPYENFLGKRILISPVTIGGAGLNGSSVSNIQVGIVPAFAALGGEPIDSFACGLTPGYTELAMATPAIGISMNVTAAASCTFYGAVVGTSTKRKDANRPPAQFSKLQRLPIAQNATAATGSFNVTVTPTLPFWGRKLCLSDYTTTASNIMGLTASGATAGMSQININALSVGVNPQFLNLPSASAPVPAAVFNNLAEHMWVDFDMADTAVPYTFQCSAVGTGSVFFGGVIEGDVDVRNLSGSGYGG